MGFMAPKTPDLPAVEPAPEPPKESDDEVQAAKKAAQERIKKMFGRAFTIHTSARGDLSEAPVKKKTLLGE